MIFLIFEIRRWNLNENLQILKHFGKFLNLSKSQVPWALEYIAVAVQYIAVAVQCIAGLRFALRFLLGCALLCFVLLCFTLPCIALSRIALLCIASIFWTLLCIALFC